MPKSKKQEPNKLRGWKPAASDERVVARVPTWLHEELRVLAEVESRTINNLVVHLVREALAARSKKRT